MGMLDWLLLAALAAWLGAVLLLLRRKRRTCSGGCSRCGCSGHCNKN